MAILEKKLSDGTWGVVTPSSAFPAQIPIRNVQADLVSISITKNGQYNPYPHDGYGSISVDVHETPFAIISASYPVGSTCTCTKGGTVLTAEGTGGHYNFQIPEAGTWTIACTNGVKTTTDTVVISQQYQLVTIILTYAVPVLNDNDWQTISDTALAGKAANFWSVGDCKAVTINGTVGVDNFNITLYVYILGFNHNGATNTIDFGTWKTASSGGKDVALIDSHYSSSKTDGSKWFQLCHWGNNNYGGWAGADCRYDILGSTNVAPSGYGSAPTSSRTGYDATATCATNPVANTLMAALPSDLRAVMKPMEIYTDNTGHNASASAVTKTIDYLPLLAEYEIFGTRYYANTAEQNYQAQYAYYLNGNSKQKYKHSSNTTNAEWKGRSPYSSDVFTGVNTSGSYAYSYAQYSYGLAPIFRV